MAKRKSNHGNGSIHMRKDGRWEGRYVIGYNEKGLPKTKNVLAKTKRECEQKLKELRASLKGTESERPKADMTFGTCQDCWYRTDCKPAIRPKTQADYENRIYQHIIPELGHIPLAKLTPGDLQQFYIRLKQEGRLLRRSEYGPGLFDRMVKSCHVKLKRRSPTRGGAPAPPDLHRTGVNKIEPPGDSGGRRRTAARFNDAGAGCAGQD